MSDGVFVVPVLDRWLVHAPLHHVTALVNRAAVAKLKAGHLPPGSGPSAELYAALTTNPGYVPRSPKGAPCPEFLGLIPTRACNLACAYCGFGASESGPETMDLDLAVAAVDWMADHVRDAGRSTLKVHFFGGEPFCAPDVVEVAVHRARARAAEAGLTPRFEVATNGFFDGGRCRFVGDYFDTVVLSLDGPAAVHNRHRPKKGGRGSYDTVARNARLLAQMPVELCLRICVTQGTVGSLETITRWLCQTFRPSAIAFETLQPTPESEAAGLRPPDPWELAVRCVLASSLAASLGVTPVYAAASIEAVRHSFCPVGRDTLIVSPDGRVSACYLPEREWTKRGLDLNLGQLDGMGKMHLDPAALDRVRNLTDSPPRCRHCLARWHCAGGCHVNHAYPGCPDTYDAFCIQTRIITVCRLLEELSCHEAVQRLLDHRPALERLALHLSDRLADWEASSQRSREAGGPCPSPQEKLAPGPRPAVSYRCHPEGTWAVESVGLTLIRRDTGRRLALGYPEAALWELLSREVPLPRLTRMMAAIAGLELQAARAWVTETIGGWVQGGWLVQGRDDD